ncbi:ABC transporter permease [Candidatus Saccharibacteria bacterium]|nr:ABC transporter permease [Candidatus Saccharibacteria bacterium]MBQ6375619.1 ABC transporter permease [Candidatus Saccharibacteria bacterium]
MSIPRVLNRKNRILLAELTKTDFKLRYQGSVLGYLWALLRPLMMFAVLYTVFSNIFPVIGRGEHYAIYLLIGTTMWSFFTECTSQGIQSIIVRGDLLRKISFPKYIVVVSSTLTAVINMLINLVVIIVFALINGIAPSPTWLLIIPAIIELYLLSLGIAFLLGSINVKYRDITSIWDVIVQALFYAVPIIYTIDLISNVTLSKIILLNPIAQAIQDIRHGFIGGDIATTWSFDMNPAFKIIPPLLVIFFLITGALTFRKKSKFFAEEV